LLLLHEEVVSSTEDDKNKEDNAKDLAAGHFGLAGLKLGLERLNLFAAALVNGIAAVSNILDELLADLLDLELSVLVVGGALGGLLVKSKTGAVRNLLASELVVGDLGLRGAGFIGEEIKLCVGEWKEENESRSISSSSCEPPRRHKQISCERADCGRPSGPALVGAQSKKGSTDG